MRAPADRPTATTNNSHREGINMSIDDFEEIGSVSGTFAKWDNVGDSYQGVILAYSVDGGTDFNGEIVPQIVLGTKEHGNVIINGSQASLKRNLANGAPKLGLGRICRITFSGTFEAPKGLGKEFTILARDAKPGEVEELTGAPGPDAAPDDDF